MTIGTRFRFAAVLLFALGSLTGAVSASATTNPSAIHPVQNIVARPNFESSGPCHWTNAHAVGCVNPCFVGVTGTVVVAPYENSRACTNYVLAAINSARAIEHIAPMVLPSDWYSLSVTEQLYVVINLERTARGLPAYVGLTRGLDTSARAGAIKNVDPWFVRGVAYSRFTSILADASPSPLAADYVWMYNDGWGGSLAATSNVDCTSAQAPACWGHRTNILGGYIGPFCHNCQMGVAFRNNQGTGAYAAIFVKPRGRLAPMYFTWSRDVVPFLASSTATTTTIITSIQ
ncbi:MAG: hypothetical protein KGJ39_03335 [Acidobacteriota bacterium]|nr:hypothetical protein [Acidobacteriota bacterium]